MGWLNSVPSDNLLTVTKGYFRATTVRGWAGYQFKENRQGHNEAGTVGIEMLGPEV